MTYRHVKADEGPEQEILLADIATHDTVALVEGCSLSEALRTMAKRQISSVVVIGENDRPTGIFTERDLVRCYSAGVEVGETRLGEVMTSPVHTVRNDAAVDQAAETMHAHGVRHLVLVDSAGRIDGLLSEHDLAQVKFPGLKERHKGVEENFLRTLIDTLPDLIWLKDAEGVYLACNTRFEQFYGAKEAEIVGKTDYDFTDRELADFFRRHDRRAMALNRSSVNEEWITFASDGHRELLETVKTPMRDRRGRLVGVLGIGRDITARQKAEGALRESENRLRRSEEMLRSLIDAIPDTVQFKDAQGRWLEANLSARQAFGLGDYECNGKTDLELSEITDPHYRDSLRQCHATDEITWQSGDLTRVEETVTLPDGSQMTFDVIKKPLFSDDGERKAMVVLGHDVTDLKQTEEALRRTLKEYRDLVHRVPVGVYKLRIDATGGLSFDYVSQRWCETSDLTEEEAMDNAEAALATLHPDDRESLIRLYSNPGDTLVWEGRMDRKEGEPRWLHIEAQATRLGNGDTLWDGIQYDITNRRAAEEALRITASVFDTSQEAILISDADNLIIDVNPAFSRITGYSREEVLGRSPKLLSSGRHDRRFYDNMWRSIKRNRVWRGEIWNRRKSGETYAEMLSITAICDAQDSVERYVAVFSDISQIKAHEAELSRVAHYDSLTGIPNRVLLADHMHLALAQAARARNMLAVCYLDLDGFKQINDALGHEAGDRVLIEVARRIEVILRGGDTVARLGGDEFVILLLNLKKGEEWVVILERLLKAIAQPIAFEKGTHALSASIGVSLYPQDGEHPDMLLRHADQAMYLAKQSGKNQYRIYDVSLDRRTRRHQELLSKVRRALEQEQFELYYQPKINLHTREPVGVEALIRWQHPGQGLLLPGEFLPSIEGSELDIEIGEWVIRNALKQSEAWRRAGLDIEVSINISAHHLESPHFVERLRRQIELHPATRRGSLQIEVLETTALDDTVTVRRVINECHQFGVRFALDDFGTGYSSLTYLSTLPVDVLKIDRSFVLHMLEDKGDMAIVQGIIALARAFGREIVAEGIETEAHYQVLLEMGCETGQGFGIAYPMPADKVLEWIKGDPDIPV